MFSMKHLIILSALVCVAYCSIGLFVNTKSKTKEGYCEHGGVFVKVGDSAKIGEYCANFKCLKDYSLERTT